jgi:hypothetical protein
MDRVDETYFQRMANADVLLRRLLDQGHTPTGEMLSVQSAAEGLGWSTPRTTDAARLLHDRRWVNAFPADAFEKRNGNGHTKGSYNGQVLLRLSDQGFDQIAREMAARTQSNELARHQADARKAQRWAGLCLVLLGLSLLLNFILVLGPA